MAKQKREQPDKEKNLTGGKGTRKRNTAADQRKPAKKKEDQHSWIEEFRYGQSISIEFFKSNAWLILIIVVCVIALMGLRYKTKTNMVEIKKLNQELRKAESEMLYEKSSYMTLIRETEMKKMVQERGLTLEFQEQPPYELSITEQ